MTLVFFFNDTATTEIYTLSLHDALPIYGASGTGVRGRPGAGGDWGWRSPRQAGSRRSGSSAPYSPARRRRRRRGQGPAARRPERSEEHTSELQSRQYLVCRLLLEKKKK